MMIKKIIIDDKIQSDYFRNSIMDEKYINDLVKKLVIKNQINFQMSFMKDNNKEFHLLEF